MQYYNIHSHIFTMNNAPRNFLQLYIPKLAANIVDKVTNTQPGAASVGWLLSHLGGNGGKRYASFLKIGKSRNQLEVFEALKKQYNDDPIRFIALTMYMEKCGAEASMSGFAGQLEGIIDVKKQYPDDILIFMGIDPRWQINGTELRKKVESYFDHKINVTATRSVYPFVGLKIYPSTGFYAFDERLTETFEWAADNGVPVLSHCNYLGGIYNNDKDYLEANLYSYDPYTGQNYTGAKYLKGKKFGKWLLGTNAANNNKNTCSFYLEPASYQTLLSKSKFRDTLKLCLAHFGGGNQILASMITNPPPYGVKGMNWFQQIQSMLTNHSNLYTDISYAIHDEKVFKPVFAELDNSKYGRQIMFGTDFFMTEREKTEKDTYRKFRNAAMTHPLTNFNNISAWDQVAGNNTHDFLYSKYYNGNVI